MGLFEVSLVSSPEKYTVELVENPEGSIIKILCKEQLYIVP